MGGRTNSQRVSRRKYIGILGAALAASTAGCGGDGGGSNYEYEVDGEAPARVELLDAGFDEDVVFGDSFGAEVTFVNTGGEAYSGNTEVSLALVSAADVDPQTAELNTDELASGEELTHTIGEFDAVTAGEFRLETGDAFAAVHDGAEDVVTVQSRQAAAGDAIETPDNVRFTVGDVHFEQALIQYDEYEETAELRSTLDDRIIARPSISVENAASSGVTIGEDAVTVIGGSAVSGIDPATIDAPDVRGAQVNPGEQIDGWIASAVDVDALSDLQVGIHAAATDTPADVIVDVGGDYDVPEFELANATVPSQRQAGNEEFVFEVENVGAASGRFRGTVEYLYENEDELGLSLSDAGVWYKWDKQLTAEIPAGETRTVSFGSSSDLTVSYRVHPFEYEFTVQSSGE